MDNYFTLAPSWSPLRPSITQSLENDLSSALYEQSCPYRRDECDAGLGLKFRLVESLGAEGIPYSGDSFGDRRYIDTRDARPCSDRCLCRYHSSTESEFVFLAEKTENSLNLIIYDPSLYSRIARALGWNATGFVSSQHGFSVDGFALLRNFEVLVGDFQALKQWDHMSHQDDYLVSSMRLLVDGFLGDEEVFRSFGHTFLHEQQHISFDLWKDFQASQAVNDIELMDHGFHEAELGRASRQYEEELATMPEQRVGRRNAAEVGSTATPTVKASEIKMQDQDSTTISSSPKGPPQQSSKVDIDATFEHAKNIYWIIKEFCQGCVAKLTGTAGLLEECLETVVRIMLLQIEGEKKAREALSGTPSLNVSPDQWDFAPAFFDPKEHPRQAAAQMECALRFTIEHSMQEIGQVLVDWYLVLELYKFGNFEGIIIEAAKNRCHWILSLAPRWTAATALELACLAAQHSAHRPLQPILEALSSSQPDLFRLCVERAARFKDNHSIQQLLSAAQNSKRLQHASMIWDAAMTGDAQMLWCIFGRGSRTIIFTLFREAGDIRMQHIHEEFTKAHPQLLTQLHEASHRYSITMSEWVSKERTDPVSTWNRGIIVLKLLVRGRLADRLPDVMLVLSIASVLSNTLDSTYTGTTKWSNEFLRDLPRWQALLHDSLHAAYAYCVRGLWGVEVDEATRPEPLSEGNLLDRFQSLAICLLRDTTDGLGGFEAVSKNSLSSLSSSQRRRELSSGPVGQTSEELPADFPPSHEAPTRHRGPWDNHIGDESDPKPDKEADICPRTRQAIIQNLQLSIPSHKVLSILIMMGAIFFCLLQFTFFMRLCQTSLPGMKPTAVSLCPSTFGSSLLAKPLETLADKCDFLEFYFGLDNRATMNVKVSPKPRLGLTLSTPASPNASDVSRNQLDVEQLEYRMSDGTQTSSGSQSINESSPFDDEHEPPPSSTSSRTPNPEPTSVAKPEKVCTICNVSFLTSSNFQRHKREKHNKGRFACDICGKNYSRATYAKIHKCRGKPVNASVRAIRPRMT